MQLSEAAKQGISRVCGRGWLSPTSYIKINILEGGMLGSWFRLYSRDIQESLGQPTPQCFLVTEKTMGDFEAYSGPLDPVDKE